MKLKPTIGMEVHMELSTETKMFCTCSADHFAKKPNTQTCPICLGLPGALPFANERAVGDTIKLGLALDCKKVNSLTKFDRKHYFYADLPKGYQISQYDLPLCEDGIFVLKSGKSIGITRVHLEEDTGKLIHKEVNGKPRSLVDFNRSGVPLMEIVTEPDFESIEEVDEFLREVRLIARYLEVSSADMEKGSMRLEANVSLSKNGKLADYKVELKNINSFKFLSKAVEAELKRQEKAIKDGKKLRQETRGYNEDTGKTFPQRTKEEAKDYRYFPEPDLPPIELGKQQIEQKKKDISKLPSQIRKEFVEGLKLPANYVEVLIKDKRRMKYFLDAVDVGKKHKLLPKTIADAMVNLKMDEVFKEPAGLIKKLVVATQRSYTSIDKTKKAVEAVLEKNEKAVKEYKDGKVQVIGFLIGQVQGALRGKGDVKVIKSELERKLKNE